MEDIGAKLLEEVQETFTEKLKNDTTLASILKKVEAGKATYKQAYEYAVKVGENLAKSYQAKITAEALPNGKMYYNIAKKVIEPTLTQNHQLISDVCKQIQYDSNKKAKLGLNAVSTDVNQDKIQGILDRVSYEDDFNEIKWILDEPIVNFSQAVVNDFIQSNAEFQFDAGLEAVVQRKVVGGCCKWCSNLAGTYNYPDVPHDVYRQHENCRCIVEFIPNKKTRKNDKGIAQNVHTKTWR